MKKRIVVSLCGLFCVAFVASAHDFFLIPHRFHVNVGDEVEIAIHVDERFPGKAVEWNPDRVVRFLVVGSGGAKRLTTPPMAGDPPAPPVKLEQAGDYLFVLDWQARLITLGAKEFNDYLEAAGLDDIVALRKQRAEMNKPGRERYSRYVKTMVTAGAQRDETYRTMIGQKIEIVSLQNPALLHRGDTFEVQVLYEGKPLSNALVSATYANYTEKPDTYAQNVRSTRDGRARFSIDHTGAWLIRTQHMIPLKDSAEADWESFWALLTFELN